MPCDECRGLVVVPLVRSQKKEKISNINTDTEMRKIESS